MSPEDKITLLENRIQELENTVNTFVFPDRYQYYLPSRFSGSKIGFFNVPMISQPSTTGTVSMFANSGTALNDHSTSAGYTNSGTYYTISDIVGALKALGLLAK